MDEADMRLLYYLDLDSRSPVKKLAHLSRMKPEKAEARLRYFFENNIVKRCYPELNRAKLGCHPFKVYVQFQDMPAYKLDEVYQFLASMPNIGWVAECSGIWDMIFAIWAKSVQEFNRSYEEFLGRYHEFVLKKVTSITVEYYVSNKKWLDGDDQKGIVVKGGGIPQDMVEEADARILRALAKDSRSSSLVLSDKTGIDANDIDARIKKMEKEGVIIAFQTDLNLNAFNRSLCKAFIYLTKSSKAEEERLLDYCFRHPEITAVVKCVGPWDMEIEAHSKSFNDFTEMMNDIRNRYPTLIRNYEGVVINKESGTMYRVNPHKQ